MKQGVIYMAWGENASEQAKQSIRSLRLHEPNLPVLVVGDKQSLHAFGDADLMPVECYGVDADPFDDNQKKGFKFLAGRVKPLLYQISPFEQTLYVDADTMFVQSPRVGFDLLNLWDVALAETQTRCLEDGIAGKEECQATAKEFGTGLLLYHNSGMIFWKKNERVKNLFDLWHEEWLRYQGWDEQVALKRALLRSEALFLNLPYTWNHSEPNKAYLITHWFGAGDARFDLKPRVRDMKAAIISQKRSPVMVRVKIAGGQFVKCRPGEEEEIRSRLLNQVNNRKDEVSMADRGPMVKVIKGHGQYVKMYKKDAEALGLNFVPEGKKAVTKEKKAPENKMIQPGENKAIEVKVQEKEDFTVINGIGASSDEALHAAGIHTFEDLLDGDVSFLSGPGKKAVEKWRDSVTSPESA